MEKNEKSWWKNDENDAKVVENTVSVWMYIKATQSLPKRVLHKRQAKPPKIVIQHHGAE